MCMTNSVSELSNVSSQLCLNWHRVHSKIINGIVKFILSLILSIAILTLYHYGLIFNTITQLFTSVRNL
jgi:hypothetical protein